MGSMGISLCHRLIPFLAAWEPGEAFFRSFDLMMVSIEGWQLLMSGQNPWLVHIPATLILKV